MARNILRGGGKTNKVAIEGLRELERKLKALSKDNPELKREMQSAVAAGAKALRDEMVSQARQAGWGSERALGSRGARRSLMHFTGKVRAEDGGFRSGGISGDMAVQSIFKYGRARGLRGDKITALAGVTKPETMVEWTAGPKNKPGLPGRERKRDKGEKVAMSFATMLEFGTSIMRARPAIRPAVRAAQGNIVASIAEAWRGLLEKYSQ